MSEHETRLGGNAIALPAVQAEPVMLAPAPLPSLRDALERRAAIFGPTDIDVPPAAARGLRQTLCDFTRGLLARTDCSAS